MAACTSPDDQTIAAGLRWTASDALQMLSCLSSYDKTALQMMDSDCCIIAVAALAKYMKKPSVAASLESSLMTIVSVATATKTAEVGGSAKGDTPNSSKPARSSVDGDELAAAVDKGMVTDEQMEFHKELKADLLTSDIPTDERVRPEPLLACRLLLNLCNFPEVVEVCRPRGPHRQRGRGRDHQRLALKSAPKETCIVPWCPRGCDIRSSH